MRIIRPFKRWARLLTSATLVLMTSLSHTACSSDNEDNDQEEDDSKELALIRERQDAEMILSSLCKIDSVPECTVTYSPRIGEIIYLITPTISYTIANNVSQARHVYNGIVSFMCTDSLGTAQIPTEVKRGDVHLTFSTSSAEGEIARITVDCPRLKNVLTEIVFVPETAWPDNADVSSPFNFASLWRQKTTGLYYICTKDAKGGNGQMLTFDGGWADDWFRKYDHWQGEFYLWDCTSTQEALTGLSDCMMYSSSKFKELKDALKNRDKNSGTYKMLEILYDERRCVTFDRNYTYDHHVWWAFNCYDVTLYKTTFYSDYSVQHWSAFYTHDNTPQKSTPSHSFSFDRSYKRYDWEWEAIYR